MKIWRKKQGFFPLFFLFFCFLSVLWAPQPCLAQEQAEQHVYDDAGYFKKKEENQLEDLCLAYGEEIDANIVMLIEDGVENKAWKQFLEDFYDAHETLGDCALLLLDINEEERRIEIQGYGEMEYIITDTRIDTIIDAMIDNLSSGEYYSALIQFPTLVKRYHDMGAGSDARTHTGHDNEIYNPYYYEKEKENKIVHSCMLALPAALLIGGIGTGIFVYNSGGKMTSTYHNYMDESRQSLIGRYDRYTHTTRSERRKPQETHSGGGGHGGGVSSGGSSHSGGGRSF